MAKNSIKVRVQWGYTGTWAGEFATATFRFGCYRGDEDVPVGELAAIPETSNDSSTGEGGANATWTYTSNWAAEYPAPDSPQVFGKELQLAAADRVLAWWNSIRSQFPSDIRMESVSVILNDTSGDSPYPASVFRLKTPVPGSSTSNPGTPYPPQIAVAVSYRAPIAGRRGRGRVFLPPINPTPANASSRLIPAAVRTALETAMINFLEGFIDLDPLRPQDSYFMPVIASDTSSNGVIPTEVGTGQKFDTQRRRANALGESQNWQQIPYLF